MTEIMNVEEIRKKMARDRAEAERQGLIYIPRTEEERRVAIADAEEVIAYHNKIYAEKEARKQKWLAVWHTIAFVLFTPFVIAFDIISKLLRAGGCFMSIGLPFGLYCLYKAFLQWRAGVPLCDISQTTFIGLFVIIPFAALALSVVLEKLANWMEMQTL